MKKRLFIILLFYVIFLNALEVGDSLPNFKIKDQFGEKNILKSDIKLILFTSSKAASETVNNYLLSKKKGFLKSNKACYLADISAMPSLIAKFFALPKMRKYPFKVMLLNEEQASRFDEKEDHITIYVIKNSIVVYIKYFKTKEDLDLVF